MLKKPHSLHSKLAGWLATVAHIDLYIAGKDASSKIAVPSLILFSSDELSYFK